MYEHNLKTKDEALTRAIRQLIIAPPLEALISPDFDYAAFANAIENDPKLSDEQKERITEHFNPETNIAFAPSNPGPTITAYIEMGASLAPPKDPFQSGLIGFDMAESPLAPDHDVSKMWKEVWQQTLVHYAAEATEYEQAMAEKGKPMLDDPSGYPARTPPILLDREMQGINASAGLGGEGKIVATVTEDFLTKLEPEEQRAVLFHEAQHAFEPVLNQQTPIRFFLQNKGLSILTGNYATRNLERRADDHAGSMGAGSDLQTALNKLEENHMSDMRHRRTVLRHLADNGFSIDNQSLGEILEAVEAEISPEPEAPTGRIGSVVSSAAERMNDYLINKHANGVNNRLQQGAGIETPQPKIKQFASHLRNTISRHTTSHPETSSRVDALGATKPCNGCADPSPFTSHGDRVKAISESGIQGIVR